MVTLEDAPYPVVLHLITESQARRGRVGDALVVFRLDRGGPNAKPAVLAPPAPEAVSADLLEFVHGVPPDGARPSVSSLNIRARGRGSTGTGSI